MKSQYLLAIAVLATIVAPLAQHKAFAAEEDNEVYMEAGSQDANSGKGFAPKELTVSVGTTVKWENKDTAGHTVTSGHPGDSDSGLLFDSTKDPAGFLVKPGAIWQHTFDKAGKFPYFCQVHPWMMGTIIVESQETPPQMTATTPAGVKVTLSWAPVTIEPSKEVAFTLKFFDKGGNPINNAQYDFMLIREGTHLTHRSLQPISQGISLESFTFKQAQTGPINLRLENINLTSGENVEFAIQVVPEFPFGVAIVMASVFATMTLVSYRYRNVFGLFGKQQ